MHKWLMAVLCAGMAHGTACSQTDTSQTAGASHLIYLKINPLALLELDGGVSFSAEYISLKSRLGFQLEVQPVFLSADRGTDFDGTNTGIETPENTIASGIPWGIKLRPEVRYYFPLRTSGFRSSVTNLMDDVVFFKKRRAPVRTYVALDFLYKHTQRERLGQLTVQNGGVGPAYLQRAVYTDVKNVVGADAKIGALSSISKSNRWLIEAWLGLGLRWKKYTYKNLPPGTSTPRRNPLLSLGNTENNQLQESSNNPRGISLPAGFKLVYQVK